MSKKFDPLELQHNVKRNASDIQDFIADLGSWEDGIKTKDKKLLKVLRDLPERKCGQRDREGERARARAKEGGRARRRDRDLSGCSDSANHRPRRPAYAHAR